MKNTSRHLQSGIVLAEKYQIEEGIGDGGFSLTYRAKDLALERTVAIKEFFPRGMVERGEDGKMVVANNNEEDASFFREEKEKFIEEGRRLAKFYSLPGVVSVLNFFMENGTAYLVMDYIDGETLAQRLKSNGKPFAVKEILEDLRPVVLALQKIHEAGLVHRDISPDNIMISREDNKVYLIDFGTARVSNSDSDYTLSVYYRPDGYTPVEQLRSNGQQGPWTDVYAFCATVYRCITGKCPDDVQSRLEEDGLKRPSELGVNIDPEVEAALMDGLAIFAKNRVQDMKELFRRLYDPGVTVPGSKEEKEDVSVTVPVKHVEDKPTPKPLPVVEKKENPPKEEHRVEEPKKVEIAPAAKESKKGVIGLWLVTVAVVLAFITIVVVAFDASKYEVNKSKITMNDGSVYTEYDYDLYSGEYAGGRVVYYFELGTKNLEFVRFYNENKELAKTITIEENGKCLVDGSTEHDYSLQWKKRETDIRWMKDFLKNTTPYITVGDYVYSTFFSEQDGSYGWWRNGEDGDLDSLTYYNASENYTEITYFYKGTDQIKITSRFVGCQKYDDDKDGVTRIIKIESFYEDGSTQSIRYYEDGYSYAKEYDENGNLISEGAQECTLATE